MNIQVASIGDTDEKLIWAVHRASTRVDTRWGGLSVGQLSEELNCTDLDKNEKFLLLRAWQFLATQQATFFRLWSGYDAMYRSLCDQSLDYLDCKPEIKQLEEDSSLLSVYAEAYEEARHAAGDAYALKALTERLTSENSFLIPQAAAELAHAWMLCKTTLCMQAAYLCIQQGDILEAKRWLETVNDEAPAEIPEGITVPDLQKWFDSNMTAEDGKSGFLTMKMATEAIRASFPGTTRQISLIKAQGIEETANEFWGSGYVFDTLIDTAATLRGDASG